VSVEPLFDLDRHGWQHGPMLALGLVVLIAAVAGWVRQRRRRGSVVLPGFFAVVGLLLPTVAGLALWEHRMLSAALAEGRAQVVEGVVQSHEVTLHARWNANSKRYDRSTWEAFYVGPVAFGFTRDGSAVGFTNGGGAPLVLSDGDVLRVHYVEQTPGDFASRRIVRLERLSPDRATAPRG
jgi:hypothetical protein